MPSQEKSRNLQLRKVAADSYAVYHENGVFLGHVICDVAEWTWFVDATNRGGIPAHILQEISERMVEMNKELLGESDGER
jgi:hypothetical protein